MMTDPPVCLMFHSVGLDGWSWRSPQISESIGTFERKIKALAQTRWTSFFLTEMPIESQRANAAKNLLLTFDDGYLDNWVHVFPMLKKFGMKATIFVTPQFVDRRGLIRPQSSPGTVQDLNHNAARCCAGFLSWAEMRKMENSCLVDIQSHALTHTWYFKGPKIVDFWHPGAATEPGGPVWMLWNRFPEFKPFYLTKAKEYEKRIPYGTPIYEYGKALVTRRYFPDEEELEADLVDCVYTGGEKMFFTRPNWREELLERVTKYRRGKSKVAGTYESEDDYLLRVRNELAESKRILEERLEKTVDGICWPGGGVTEEVLAIARDAGYKYFTLPSAWKSERAKGKYADMIPRIGSFSRIMWRGREIGVPTGREFIWYIERHRGSLIYKWIGRCARLFRIVQNCLRCS